MLVSPSLAAPTLVSPHATSFYARHLRGEQEMQELMLTWPMTRRRRSETPRPSTPHSDSGLLPQCDGSRISPCAPHIVLEIPVLYDRNAPGTLEGIMENALRDLAPSPSARASRRGNGLSLPRLAAPKPYPSFRVPIFLSFLRLHQRVSRLRSCPTPRRSFNHAQAAKHVVPLHPRVDRRCSPHG